MVCACSESGSSLSSSDEVVGDEIFEAVGLSTTELTLSLEDEVVTTQSDDWQFAEKLLFNGVEYLLYDASEVNPSQENKIAVSYDCLKYSTVHEIIEIDYGSFTITKLSNTEFSVEVSYNVDFLDELKMTIYLVNDSETVSVEITNNSPEPEIEGCLTDVVSISGVTSTTLDSLHELQADGQSGKYTISVEGSDWMFSSSLTIEDSSYAIYSDNDSQFSVVYDENSKYNSENYEITQISNEWFTLTKISQSEIEVELLANDSSDSRAFSFGVDPGVGTIVHLIDVSQGAQ